MKKSEKTFLIAIIPVFTLIGLMIITLFIGFGYITWRELLNHWNNKNYLEFSLLLITIIIFINFIIFVFVSDYYEKKEKKEN